ncbi:hypothetical protein RRG08_055069 [Elysia crispata]|uniref:Uncharacterized protein n=1 Tax=Elysia crispata TaxID=231223 RepID=A0AAE1AZY3_9GAST|nr:hypothetical protein RRG08_055069 [Elysia crispata]
MISRTHCSVLLCSAQSTQTCSLIIAKTTSSEALGAALQQLQQMISLTRCSVHAASLSPKQHIRDIGSSTAAAATNDQPDPLLRVAVLCIINSNMQPHHRQNNIFETLGVALQQLQQMVSPTHSSVLLCSVSSTQTCSLIIAKTTSSETLGAALQQLQQMVSPTHSSVLLCSVSSTQTCSLIIAKTTSSETLGAALQQLQQMVSPTHSSVLLCSVSSTQTCSLIIA